jgi:hypothetical protein
MLTRALNQLLIYVENEQLNGYDPYDTLNSWFPFQWFGKWGPPVSIQIQKRNPINIRPFLGIKKEINPKGMGLFLKVYSLLYAKTKESTYLKQATAIFEWLNSNYSNGYSGKCWGYNFDWASPGSYIKAYTPSVVVTSFVIDGVYDYFKISGDPKAAECILSAADYILNDIPVSNFETGISFSYTDQEVDVCYNASLLAAEILVKANTIKSNRDSIDLVKDAVRFVLSKQNNDGSWFYSFNPESKTERKQIDFHQGFILVSLFNINQLLGIQKEDIKEAITKGLFFYRNKQFLNSGQSLWRLPKKWPVDIHNQSQGIITFTKLKEFDDSYSDFAKTIAEWTINNMQSHKGFFYYRKNKLLTNKIPYMRWSQAWMMLALTELIVNENQ